MNHLDDLRLYEPPVPSVSTVRLGSGVGLEKE